MPNRSNSARGLNRGSASRAEISSKSRSAVSAEGATRTPKTETSSWVSQNRLGVPRNRCQLAARSRQMVRPSVWVGLPSTADLSRLDAEEGAVLR